MAEVPAGYENQTVSPTGGASGAARPGPPGKPDIGKRAVAAIIDAVIAVAIGFIPVLGGIIAAAYWLLRDGMEFEFMDRRSIGKKVMKLRPVRLDGSPMDMMASAKRNWMFALGGVIQLLVFTIVGIVLAIPLALIAFLLGIVELILVLTDPEGRRLGDKIAGTRVVEVDS